MAPPLIDGVHPSHHRTLRLCLGQAKRVLYTTVCNRCFQSLFTPIKTILYFFKRLQIFLGIGHPISKNKCSHFNLQKDCVQSFPTYETYAVLCTSFPMGTMTSADFSSVPTHDCIPTRQLAHSLKRFNKSFFNAPSSR
jgi:Trk-type K+ transport system membrane component